MSVAKILTDSCVTPVAAQCGAPTIHSLVPPHGVCFSSTFSSGEGGRGADIPPCNALERETPGEETGDRWALGAGICSRRWWQRQGRNPAALTPGLIFPCVRRRWIHLHILPQLRRQAGGGCCLGVSRCGNWPSLSRSIRVTPPGGGAQAPALSHGV